MSLLPELNSDSPAVTALAVRGGRVYVAVNDTFSTGHLWSVPTTGGPHTVVVDSIASPSEIAVDATHIYWLAGSATEPYGSVGRAPIEGGPAEILDTTNTLESGLRLDDHAVYFGRLWGFDEAGPDDKAVVVRSCKSP